MADANTRAAMRVISVNVARARAIDSSKPSRLTGIFKEPQRGLVRVTKSGLQGDAIIDSRVHGGVDQAVYIYGTIDYAWWTETLEFDLEPGIFGENLTVSGLESAPFRIGDRLHVGSVILEVTAPRGPCGTLATRMGDANFVKRFRAAGRPGLYCRVIREGAVQPGDLVTVEPYPNETVTILEMFRDNYDPQLTEAAILRFLNAPIAERARESKEEQLARIRGGRV